MTKEIMVIYHNDNDGFAAALAAWLKFEDRAYYVATNYNEPMPEIPESVKMLFVLDFSFSREVTKDLAERYTLTVIDHHKSAAKNLRGLPSVHINLAHSGCVLAWEYFHSPNHIPELFKHIEDRDLWKWEVDGSDAVNLYLDTMPKDFSLWRDIMVNPLDDVVLAGSAIQSWRNIQVKQAVETVQICDDQDGNKVGVVYSPVLQSEIGNTVCDTTFVDYCDVITYTPSGVRHALRSRGDFDVSKIAMKNGGGGHKNAAGFFVSKRGE